MRYPTCGRPLLAMLALALCASVCRAGATAAPADTSRVYPARVHHRPLWEEAAALPGRAIYLPISVLGFGARHAATVIWEERLLDRLKGYLTFAGGRAGVRPLANSLSGGGARFFLDDALGEVDAEITSAVGASTARRQHHILALCWPGGRCLRASYRNRPRSSFHGLGRDSRPADRSSFGQRDLGLQFSSHCPLSAPLTLNWDLSLHRTSVGAGQSQRYPATVDVYAGQPLPGLRDDVSFAEIGLCLRALHVDVPGSPTRGNRTRLRLVHSQSIDDDEYSHLKASLLSEQFAELWYRRTVSLRLGAEWRLAPSHNDIPFYELATIGGTEILRGYKEGRYRDNGVVHVAGTYKFPIWKLIEGALFYESGRTFHQVDDLTLDRWLYSCGGSLRVWVPDGVLFEVTVARSPELTRLLFAFDSTF